MTLIIAAITVEMMRVNETKLKGIILDHQNTSGEGSDAKEGSDAEMEDARVADDYVETEGENPKDEQNGNLRANMLPGQQPNLLVDFGNERVDEKEAEEDP